MSFCLLTSSEQSLAYWIHVFSFIKRLHETIRHENKKNSFKHFRI